MKKTLILLALAILIAFSGCKSGVVTCIVTSPKDGAELSINDDLIVKVEASDSKGTIALVTVYLDNNLYAANNLTGDYTATVPAMLLSLGSHTIKAIAVSNEGTQGESETITVIITESLPTVTTKEVTNILTTGATSGGNVTDDGNSPVTARGVCWSASENPTINDNKTTDGSGIGSFTSNITGLNKGTLYYVRAYATNETGTSYGNQVGFTTDDVVINGVRWATRNVDKPGTFAANKEDAGMLYQWNRRIGWSSTDPMVNSNGGTTWNNSIPSGSTWEKTNDPCPPGWRVPTVEELECLINSGSQWTTENGVTGHYFGNSEQKVFFPAAGHRDRSNGMLIDVNSDGIYWSSTPDPLNSVSAHIMYFYSEFAGINSLNNRAWGFSVRCVAE